MAGALHAPAKKNYLVYQTLMRDAKIENFAVAPAGLDCGRPLKELLSTLQNRETRREIHFASSKPAGHTAYHPFRLDGEDSGFTTPCEDCRNAFAHFSRKDVMLLTGAPTKSPFDFVGLFALGDGGKAHLLLGGLQEYAPSVCFLSRCGGYAREAPPHGRCDAKVAQQVRVEAQRRGR